MSFLVAAATRILHRPRFVASCICSSTSRDTKSGCGTAEAQFYGAMKRKGWPADAKDMRSIVAIHNGVNERAWHQILRYEASPHWGHASVVASLTSAPLLHTHQGPGVPVPDRSCLQPDNAYLSNLRLPEK